MTTKAYLRTYALALPQAGEHTGRPGTATYSVGGRVFAELTKDGDVRLRLTEEATAEAATAHPTGERLFRAGRPAGFRVPLADVDGRQLNALVRAAWAARAPRRLARALAAAEAAADRPVGDLPAGIGRPATQALTGAGLTTLDAIARHTAAELLALHGLGPKAVRILTEHLREQGRTLRP
ncbi:hypothetical protein ACWGIN_31335 [Streptomyces sp. NPDC054861]